MSLRIMCTTRPQRTALLQRIRALCHGWSCVCLSFGLLACAGSCESPPAEEPAWRLLDVRTEGPCVESAMAWDPARGVFVLYGGRDRNWELLSTTWEWFPNSHAWRLVADAARQNPGPRMSHAMVWDAARERMILFGGTDLDRSFDDTWAFDGSASRWVRLDTTGNPPPRSQHGMVHDPATDQVIVFGGRGTNSQPYQDTWLLNLDTLEWIQHAPTEGPLTLEHETTSRWPATPSPTSS